MASAEPDASAAFGIVAVIVSGREMTYGASCGSVSVSARPSSAKASVRLPRPPRGIASYVTLPDSLRRT